MRVIVLGSAAGGGVPQWNCGCSNCAAARVGMISSRTQDSIAVLTDTGIVLCNASPDIARQIEATPELHPRASRGTPISAIVLTNGDLDHVVGLLSLRESQPLAIYATEAVQRGLARDAMIATLERFPGHLSWRRLELDRELDVRDPRGRPTGISVVPFALPGKPPLHLARVSPPSPEDNVGLMLTADGKRVVYAPACADAPVLPDADVVLFDGTFWSGDELIRLGLGTASARAMAHVPIGGRYGSLANVRGRCRIYTHINNSNPILADTAERHTVLAAGWEIAEDGMEILP